MTANTKFAELLKIISDSSVSTIDRRAVAEHLVQLAMDAVPEPADDDQEVLDRMKPWDDQKLAAMMGGGKGESLVKVKVEVWRRSRTRAVLAIIVDDKQPHVLREAACSRIFTDHPQIVKWRMNNYDATRLLSDVLPQSATKHVRAFEPPVPVARPPVELKDVWRL